MIKFTIKIGLRRKRQQIIAAYLSHWDFLPIQRRVGPQKIGKDFKFSFLLLPHTISIKEPTLFSILLGTFGAMFWSRVAQC